MTAAYWSNRDALSPMFARGDQAFWGNKWGNMPHRFQPIRRPRKCGAFVLSGAQTMEFEMAHGATPGATYASTEVDLGLARRP
jgi:hypothetical protein